MIKKSDIETFREDYLNNELQKLNNNFHDTSLIDLIQNKEINKEEKFDLELDVGSQYNQKHTGYCWCFASSRIINTNIAKKLGNKNFELSVNYISFYDKLERFNTLINKFKNNKDCYDREIFDVLLNGIGDGGYFTWFANLIDKYGVVPKECFPDSYYSSNTNEVNSILSRLVRKFYLEVNSYNFEEVKKKYLNDAFKILSLLYGLPPETFTYNYVDVNNHKKKISNISPKDFYKKYSDIKLLKDYVEVISYEDSVYKYGVYYEIEKMTNIEEYSNVKYLNLPFNRQKELIINQLKDNEPVCFYCYMTKKQISGLFTDLYKKYSELLGVDLNISKNDIVLTNEIKNGHAMIISGFKTKNGVLEKWKILNSRQEKNKNINYYVADNEWIEKYVSCTIINKKHLNKKELDLISKKAIIINNYNNKFK